MQMKQLIRGAGAAAALLAAVASNAWAISPGTYTNVCGGTLFETCATITIGFDAGTNTLTVDITNLSANGDKITAIGFDGLTLAATSGTVDGALSNWSPVLSGGPTDIQGDAGWQMGPGNPNTFGIANDGNTYTFTLVFTGEPGLAGSTFGYHGQAGPNGCSTKLFLDANGSPNTITVTDPACATTTVPEPVTMTLLATGLAGMGGAGLIRRKKSAK
jgi:hypothetical protein